jgi:hypothetical protein
MHNHTLNALKLYPEVESLSQDMDLLAAILQMEENNGQVVWWAFKLFC